MIKNFDEVEIQLGDLQVDGGKEEKMVITAALEESRIELEAWIKSILTTSSACDCFFGKQ
ncbi:hypothetical protein KAR34_09100 [bacterium]|nr:hypothetical protein [bacterium]